MIYFNWKFRVLTFNAINKYFIKRTKGWKGEMKNLAILLLVIGVVCAYCPSVLSAEVGSRYVEVIIKVEPGIIIMPEGAYKAPLGEIKIESDGIEELNTKYNLMSIEKMFAKKKLEEAPDLENTFLLKFPEHTDLKVLMDEYKEVEGVIYIEENKEVSIF